MRMMKRVTFGMVIALAVGTTSELRAAPIPVDTAATRAASALGALTDVRWHHRRHGWGWGRGYSRSSICWNRSRRVLCPGTLP